MEKDQEIGIGAPIKVGTFPIERKPDEVIEEVLTEDDLVNNITKHKEISDTLDEMADAALGHSDPAGEKGDLGENGFVEDESIDKVNEQARLTETEEETKLIDKLAGEYRMQGKSDEEADKLAKAQVLKSNQQAEENWQAFIKKVKLYDIIDDSIRRALIAYKESFNKKLPNNPENHIDFKLTLHKGRSHGKGVVFAVRLRFEIKRNGVWKVFNEKEIKMNHVKQVRNESAWKFSLYEAMLQGLIFNGITFMIINDDNATTETAGGQKI